jgi:glutathione S-transferase
LAAPTVSQPASRAESRLAAPAPAGRAPEVARLNWLIDQDLAGGIERLATGANSLTQQAVRRLLFARLSWFEARLRAAPYLTGAEPTAADWRLGRFLAFYGAGELPGLPPIDPVLEDYPGLAAFSASGAWRR